MASIGSQIKLHRLSLGLSQEKLAAIANVDRTYISMLERDMKSPTIDTARRVAAALGVRLSQLIEEIE